MLSTRLARLFRSALMVVALSAPALGALPRVMTIIPADGPLAVIAVDSLERSDGRVQALLAAANGTGYAGLGGLLDAMGVRAGIDLSGSAAVVLLPSIAENDPSGGVLLVLPVSDADAFFEGVKARDEEGVKAFDYAGTTYFARSFSPAYIILGNDRAAVAAFVPAAADTTNAADRLKAFGPIGARMVGSADLVGTADAAQLGEMSRMLRSLASPARDAGADRSTNAEKPADPPAGTFLEGSFPGRLMQLAQSESRGVLVAASFEPGALRVECASTFVDDGVLARAAQSPDDAGAPAESPLATMPAAPYLLALGIDAAHPGVRVLADELGPPGRSKKIAVQAELVLLNAVPSMEALSLVVYEPASIMFGSLARTVVAWRAPAPEEATRAFRAWVESLDQRPLGNAVVTSKYEPNTDGDSWTITPPAGAVPMLPMLLGPTPDVQGKTLTLPGRGYLTWSRDAKLLKSVARVGEADVKSLDRDELLARVSPMLPSPRVMEAYLDGSSVVKQFAPMLAGQHAAKELPEKLSPIGAAMTVDQGVACLTILAPADVLKALSVLNRSEPDDAPESKPKRPRRGPRKE